jgi:hypothetical protein
MARFAFPGGKRFAFTTIDDTDLSTVDNIAPMYRLLEDLGMRTTKTVWPVSCAEGSVDFAGSQTLEDDDYAEFVADLQRRGFEITWHGPTMESSRRERIEDALSRYRAVLGGYPRIHVNHALNRDNIYWGPQRVDSRLLRALFTKLAGAPGGHYLGHVPDSRYYWGDLCEQHITYSRNLTFNHINTAKFNPSMPYRDPRRPVGQWWFSASDAEDADEFNELLASRNLDLLEREGGICILATHFGKGFVIDSEVNATTRERMEELASREGWFPTVGELLDWLRARRERAELPRGEWTRMQWCWARDLALRKWRQRHRVDQRRMPLDADSRSHAHAAHID